MQGPAVRSALVGGVVWLGVSLVVGWAAVVWAGDRGSVLQLLTGAVIGVFGALAHLVVCLVPGFHAYGFLRRGLLTWLFAYAPFLAVALLLFDPAKSAAWDPNFWRTVSLFLLPYTGLPMALLAVLVALITSVPDRRAGT